MKLRRVMFVAAALAVAGCALVIDLGEKVKPYPTEAGPALDTGTPIADAAVEAQLPADAGADADGGKPAPRCGLAESPNMACADCYVQTECCDVNKKCSEDPTCVQGLECIKECLVNGPCIDKCAVDFPAIVPVTNCTIANCLLCAPPLECRKLGECVFDLPRNLVVRRKYQETILLLDPVQCEKERAGARGTDSDAAACY